MFRFEPGSYKIPGGFLSAIACYKDESENFEYILVKVNVTFKSEDVAVKRSEESISRAFKKRDETGNDMSVGRSLKLDGFKKVDDPRIAE
jgi:hypothetical protein